MRGVNTKGPALRTTAQKVGGPSNVNHDKGTVLTAPRIRAMTTRNYGKGAPNPYPDQDTQNYGAGVGYGAKNQ